MKLLAYLVPATFLGLSALALVAAPAIAGPAEDGNLYGAAQACGISTAGLPAYGSPDFEYARQRAVNSRQNCQEVDSTISRNRGGFGNFFGYSPAQQQPYGQAYGYRNRNGQRYNQNASNQGNLFGAAEKCGISTAGLPQSNSPEFQSARNNALASSQNCAQVAATVSGTVGGFGGGFERPFGYNQGGSGNRGGNQGALGNLYGAAQACGISTAGLPYSNSPDFEYARQRAQNSRQNCPEVAATISRTTGRPF